MATDRVQMHSSRCVSNFQDRSNGLGSVLDSNSCVIPKVVSDPSPNASKQASSYGARQHSRPCREYTLIIRVCSAYPPIFGRVDPGNSAQSTAPEYILGVYQKSPVCNLSEFPVSTQIPGKP